MQPAERRKAPPSRAERTRAKILTTAARQFNRHGYDGTSLRTISRATSMKAGSMYYHFTSKDELLREVIDLGVTVIHRAVLAAVEALPPRAGIRERIEVAIDTHLAVLLEYSDFTSASIRIYGQVPAAVRNRNKLVRRSYGDYWTSLLRQAQREGVLRDDRDPKLIRLLVIGMMNSTVEWFRPDRGSRRHVAELVKGMLFDGMLWRGKRR